MTQVQQQVVDLERKFWDEAGNKSFFEESMADEALAVMEPAGFIDKATAVEMNGKTKGWKDVTMKDVHVLQLSPDCVALAYHGSGKMKEDGKEYNGSICSVYIKRDGRWQMGVTSHQPWDPK